MKSNILITGASGMLGSTTSEIFDRNEDLKIFKTDVKELDICSLGDIEKYLKKNKIDLVINCAAYTNVEEAEGDGADLNKKVNHVGAHNLATATGIAKIPLFHISTDYVFNSNSKNGYKEDDSAEEGVNAYGEAKRLGEKSVLENNPLSYIFRTSWLYGPNGKNLVDTIIKLGKERDELAFVTDENGSPTYTKDLAQLMLFVYLNRAQYEPGIYHGVNEGECSRHEQAGLILRLINSKANLGETTLSAFERNAKIPNYSYLKNTKLPKLRSWELAISEYINEYHS